MGGVAEEDLFLLQEPSRAGFTQALSKLRQRVAETSSEGTRREVVVYYSGHADDRGLLLGEDRFSYRSLREQIDDIQADVHITVLDACGSGAITRLKGGQRRQAFLVDESSRMKGYAFLTSSSADEAAQESDRIGASYFTHYLVSGMRGAADVSGDGKVTLGEAYQFAFHETLATTEETQAGAQHPAYDINLTGTGDVVMTDLRQISAGLILGKSLHGRLFIRNSDQRLVAEVYKVAGRSIELGLEPGTYEIHFDQKPAKFRATVEIKDGERFNLLPENLYAVDSQETTTRGNAKKPKEVRSLSMGIVDRMEQPYDGVQLSLIGNRAAQGTGTQIASLFNISDGEVSGMQLSLLMNKAEGNVIRPDQRIREFRRRGREDFPACRLCERNKRNGGWRPDRNREHRKNVGRAAARDAQRDPGRIGRPDWNGQPCRGQDAGTPARGDQPDRWCDEGCSDRRDQSR